MSLAFDQPITNHPYHEPTGWWDYQQGQPVPQDGAQARVAQQHLQRAPRRWISAVNHYRELARWAFLETDHAQHAQYAIRKFLEGRNGRP